MAREQEQFLNVVDRDTAERLWRDVIRPTRLDAEFVPLSAALGRVLAEDVTSEVDVPSFDRSNVDGYALRAEDTFGAAEDSPRRLRLCAGEISTGVVPRRSRDRGYGRADRHRRHASTRSRCGSHGRARADRGR